MPLICRIELNKTDGITVKVENKDKGITHTAEFTPEKIILTSKGESDNSTITQTPDTITIKCKNFNLETETTNFKSTKDTLMKSDQKIDIQSSQDMTLKTDQKLSETATQDVKISGMNFEAKANTDAKMTATANAVIEGTAKAEVKGAQLSLQGQAKGEMKAAIVNIKADAMMTVEGAMTTVKGQMTTIQGSVTKVG